MLVHDVEQGTDAWHALRAGMPTASEAKKIITASGTESAQLDGYAVDLARDKHARRPMLLWGGNKWTDRGKELEPEAADMYSMMNDVDVDLVGFCTDDEQTFGCSPDRLVGTEGLLEIKCLPKNHVPCLLYWQKNQKCPPDYYPQVQFQLMVTEREWCDLYFYQPGLPDLVIRIEPIQEYQDKLMLQVGRVLEERARILEILEAYSGA